MSDGPVKNYMVEQAKLEADIAQLETRKLVHRVALLELVERRDNILRNREAELVAIDKKKKDLASLVKAHGTLTDEAVADAETTDLVPDLNAD